MKEIQIFRYSIVCIFMLLSMPSVFSQNVVVQQPKGSLKLQKVSGDKPLNVIFILIDDQRYDALGFLKAQSFIRLLI